MKRIIITALALLIVLALCACSDRSGTDSPAPVQSAAPASPSSPATASVDAGFEAVDENEPFGQYRSVDELLSILNGETMDENASAPYYETPVVEPGEQDEADGEGENAAADYTGGDNTTVFTDEPWEEAGVSFAEFEGYTADGEPADGEGEAAGADGWAENAAYTQGLPAPDGELQQTTVDAGVFYAMVAIKDAAAYDAYIEDVKESGFTADAYEEDYSAYGMNMKLFSAAHSDGRVITLTLNDGLLIIEIAK